MRPRPLTRVTRPGVGATLTAALLVAAAAGCGGHRSAGPQATSTTGRRPTPRVTTTTSGTASTPAGPATTAGAPQTTPAPTTPSGPAVVIRQGPSDRPLVALTFDAGSDTGYAAEILDVLDAEHVRATFGITGVWAEANPALVRRIASSGHQILNHTYDHRSFTGFSTGTAPLDAAARTSELERGDAAIRAAGAPTTAPWFRPPYGDEDASVRADVGAAGYHYEVMWSLDSLGWKGLSADAIVSRCLDPTAARPGAIYLFHVGADSADHAALRAVIDGLRSRGLGFTTVAGLVGS